MREPWVVLVRQGDPEVVPNGLRVLKLHLRLAPPGPLVLAERRLRSKPQHGSDGRRGRAARSWNVRHVAVVVLRLAEGNATLKQSALAEAPVPDDVNPLVGFGQFGVPHDEVVDLADLVRVQIVDTADLVATPVRQP